MGGAAAAIAAARARSERELVAHLREHSALSAETATAVDPHSPMGRAALNALVEGKAAVRTSANLYWLDESAYTAMRAGRRVTVLWTLAVLLVVLAVIAVVSSQMAPPPI
jgi:hypothetical protein